MTQEHSPAAAQAYHTYDAYEMDALPAALRRHSLDYYHLSVVPGLSNMAELAPEDVPELPDTVTNAYFHLPYCTGVCSFCSYFLTTVREDDLSPVEDYLEVMKQEIAQRAEETNLDLSYLFFGGGTPSLIPNAALARFFDFMEQHNVLSPTRYGTLELHPEFFIDRGQAQEFIDILKANGIRRVSVGFQSSDDEVLDATNRRHGANFLQGAIEFLQQNEMIVNLDLIYGLPDLSVPEWERTLRDAIAVQPDSISTYFLFVSPHTAMRTQIDQGKVSLPDHLTVQVQHILAVQVLTEAGYHELPGDFFGKLGGQDPSEFAQDALPSDSVSLPLGAGGYGYYDNTQFFNEFSFVKYRQRIAAGQSPIWRGHRFTGDTEAYRDVAVSFKNSPYLDRALFSARYGGDPLERFPGQFAVLERYGLAEVLPDRIALTPKGKLVVEEIACLFRVPNLSDEAASASTPAERRKLEKYHFAPTYPALGELATGTP